MKRLIAAGVAAAFLTACPPPNPDWPPRPDLRYVCTELSATPSNPAPVIGRHRFSFVVNHPGTYMVQSKPPQAQLILQLNDVQPGTTGLPAWWSAPEMFMLRDGAWVYRGTFPLPPPQEQVNC